MKTTVVYYFKTGNTKTVAEIIAEAIGCSSVPINIIKTGRKTKQEIEQEKQVFSMAKELNLTKWSTQGTGFSLTIEQMPHKYCLMS